MQVAIIDYGSGNLRSAAKAFELVASPAQNIIVTSDAKKLAEASHIVLPGVGAFADCMEGLKKTPGMLEALEKEVLRKRKPFLGICVGMQMLFTTGYEHGEHKGLGWIEGDIKRIETPRPVKIPHMGWNEINIRIPGHDLLEGIRSGDHVYFVHSFHAICRNPEEDVLATTDYGIPLTAVVARGNIMGTQFHPEKSQKAGLTLIKNFLRLSS